MNKENNRIILKRVASGLVALTISLGASFALKPTNAYATGSKIVTSTPTLKYKNVNEHKIGEYVDKETGKVYYTIKVIENDNASRLSETALAVYHKEKQIPKEEWEAFSKENTKVSKTSFWPAVVYLNTESGKRFHINPGDYIIFPTDYQEFKQLNGEVKASGWYSKYLNKYNIHPKRPLMVFPKEKARAIVQEIMDEAYPEANICVDDDTLRAWLRAHRENGKFEFSKDSELDNDEYYAITDWIPSPEQLEKYYTTEEKNKRKK